MLFFQIAIFTECYFEALIHRDCRIRLHADVLRQVFIALFWISNRRLLFIELLNELIRPDRQLAHPFQPLHIEEMVRLLRVLERRLDLLSPAVGLNSKVR